MVSSIFRKVRSVSLIILHEPCSEIFNGIDLRFHSWRRRHSGSDNWLPKEGRVGSQRETGFGWQKMCTLAHCQPGLLKGAQTVVCMPTHWGILTDFFSYMPQTWVQRWTSPAYPQQLVIQMWFAAGKVLLARALMWMWLKGFSFLSKYWTIYTAVPMR